MTLPHVHLAVFLSRATSLREWDAHGLFEREAAFYRRLQPHLGSLRLVTSGGSGELAYQDRLHPIELLINHRSLPPNLYSMLSPFLHRRRLREATIYRSHQLDGAWTAAIASGILGRPLMLRGGHLWAEFFARERGLGIKAAAARRLQGFALRRARLTSLATDAMKRYVVAEYQRPADSIHVVPNYVDDSLFRPRPDVQPVPGRICYVGRLHPRKNVALLLQALARVPGASLAVIGDGPEHAHLARICQDQRLPVTFSGRIPHERLPEEIARAQAFVLPSAFEGQPKALLEAMACGAAVVGTDVEGTSGVIRHEETGVLCAPTVDGLSAAIRRLLADDDLRRRLGGAARAFARGGFGLDMVVQRELALIAATAAGRRTAWPVPS